MKKLLLTIITVILVATMALGCGSSTTALAGVDGEVK